VCTQQHEPEPLVGDAAVLTRVDHGALRLLGQLGIDRQQRELAVGHGLRTQPVGDPSPGGDEQPGPRVRRCAVARPGPRRRLEGVGEPVLGEVEAAVARDEQGQQPAPLVAQGRGQRLPGRASGRRRAQTSTSSIGRTSTW
jgi:hypothetical protein